MAAWPFAPAGSPRGLQPDQQTVRVINRVGGTVAVGDLVMFDLHSVDAASTGFGNGSTASVFTNVINPATAGLTHGWFGIVTSLGTGAGADNSEIEVCLRGVVQAYVAGTDATALTDVLVAVNAQDDLDSDAGAAGEKILGIPLEVTAGATAELVWVLFDGINGFGAAVDQ